MHHLEKLLDLVWLRLPLARLQAERARDLRMRADMVTAADAAQREAERLDKTAKLRRNPRFAYHPPRGGPTVPVGVSEASRVTSVKVV
jgi:hypothetical protein